MDGKYGNVHRKNETPYAIKDKTNRIKCSSQILEEYKKYYDKAVRDS